MTSKIVNADATKLKMQRKADVKLIAHHKACNPLRSIGIGSKHLLLEKTNERIRDSWSYVKKANPPSRKFGGRPKGKKIASRQCVLSFRKDKIR